MTRQQPPGHSENEPGAFEARVYEIVASIPPGRVCSYGRVALLAGCPNKPRQVGRAMARAPAHLPCHRVVNSQGRTAPGFGAQRGLLEREGVGFKANGCVDMRRFGV